MPENNKVYINVDCFFFFFLLFLAQHVHVSVFCLICCKSFVCVCGCMAADGGGSVFAVIYCESWVCTLIHPESCVSCACLHVCLCVISSKSSVLKCSNSRCFSAMQWAVLCVITVRAVIPQRVWHTHKFSLLLLVFTSHLFIPLYHTSTLYRADINSNQTVMACKNFSVCLGSM